MPKIDEANPILYNYRSLDLNTLEMLRSREVWFSRRERLNDPFDCMPIIDMSMDDKSIVKLFRMSGRQIPEGAGIEQMREELIKHLQKQLDKSGVFWLTSANDNELMWAHYADNHRGLTIGYQPKTELFHSKEMYRYLPAMVEYLGRGSISGEDFLSRKENRDEAGMTQRALNAMFFSKNLAWEHEHEYRFIWPLSHGLRKLEADIKSVTYGMKFDRNKRELVRSFLPDGIEELVTSMNGTKLVVEPID